MKAQVLKKKVYKLKATCALVFLSPHSPRTC